MLNISMCLFRDNAKNKEVDEGVKPAMDQICVFEDLNEGAEKLNEGPDKLNEDGEEDKVEMEAGKEDAGALDEEKDVVGKESNEGRSEDMDVAVGKENTVDKTGDISESAEDKPEVVEEGRNEDTGILEKEETVEVMMKETAVDKTGDISESALDKVEDLKVAGSKILKVLKEKVEDLKAAKEEDIVEENKGKVPETIEELNAKKGEKKE